MKRNRSVVRLMLVAAILCPVGKMAAAEGPSVPHDAAYQQAKEQLADLVASEEFTKVEVAASSFDRAMEWIYTAVETYLDEAVPKLGSVDTAREYGVEILRGLNDHTIHYADEDGYQLVGERRLLISNEEEAKQLGELVARVAVMIHAAHAGRGVNIRSAARRIFEAMLPVQGTGQSLVTQYLVHLRSMTREERRALMKYALE